MANLFKNLKPTANPSKNGFDLSERHTYTARAGALYPVMCKEVVPDDYFEIDVAAMSRTQTLVAPAFARIKQFHHFFFVPYNALWHHWDEFYTQQFDPCQAGETTPPIYAPTFFFPDLCADYSQNSSSWGGQSTRYVTDMLGYGDLDSQAINSIQDQSFWDDKKQLRMNPFRILAYNKIWNDYYRNHYVSDSLNPKHFNVDDIPCTSFATSKMESYRNISDYRNMFKIKYRCWKKDIFMGAMPTMQFGDVSVVNSNFDLFYNMSDSSQLAASMYVGVRNYNGVHLALRTSSGSLVGTDYPSFTADLFDVLNLRKAEKLQEWKQKTLMAGNRAHNQYDAHFGVHPYRENDHAQFIGGFDGIVTIDEVTQTTGHDATGQYNSLGDLGGKGVGATSGQKIKFKSKDFGIIMCMVSFVPELEYNGNYVDKNNTLFEQFDWYTPEFANLGLDPVTFGQLALPETSSAILQAEYNNLIGYCPSYWWYKSSVDRCHLNLSSSGSMRYYSTPRRDLFYSAGTEPLDESYYYINPSVLNSIFGYTIDPTIATDQFVCVSNFDVKAIRPMSVLGLPSF